MLTNWICTPETSLQSTRPRKDTVPASARKKHPERYLTVGLYPEWQARKPWIRLYGLWLTEAGFTPQTRIKVKVTAGRLVITKV
ncbi:SymE family type I addiction module toxin [Collimonas silvisoli]|uniref:SymE family type I addiction module toxin n=1 Tax=Collimonas silvisoli TaxID=2825884 RepID=UPI001B8B10C3|nr:SymE family type I addiction module toxin [Collimonas silvisoli]